MEKGSLIFSILTHDYEFMRWFWLFAALPIGIWHVFYFPSSKHLTEKELVGISSEFEGINGDYIGFSVVAICLLIGFPLIVLASGLDKWAIEKFGVGFYPSSTLFGAGYGIYQGLFALRKSVYPMGKSLTYAYDDKAKIRRVAKNQILSSISAVVFAVLFFFMTV